jgi:hypothetical protein
VTTGSRNIGIGYDAQNTTTTNNDIIAIGDASANNIASGDIAIGSSAATGGMGTNGVAIGFRTCYTSGPCGNNSTIVGYQAAEFASASNLTAIGNQAGENSTGANNVYVGFNAGVGVTSGGNNVALGQGALGKSSATSASNDTIVGQVAGGNLTIGSGNVFVGTQAGQNVTTGGSNTIIGAFVGDTTLTTGSNDIIIGTRSTDDAPASGSSNLINIGSLLYLNTNSTSAPAVSSCGSSPSIDAHANNKSGTVTAGTGTVASCTITLAGSGYTTWNHCRVTSQSAESSFAYSYTLTAITVTATSLTSDKIDYDCDGY